MALPKYPKFCNIHQVIHICENMDPMFKVKEEEAKLASKVRRLHGKQTEEEIEAERQKSMPQKGSLAAILASAKENIQKEKSKLNGGQNNSNSDNTGEGKVDEGLLSERMMALRAKTLGTSSEETVKINNNSDNNSPIAKRNPPIQKNVTINDDYLSDIKERHDSMYSAVRMTDLKKRPTAAIHLPKKKPTTPKLVKDDKTIADQKKTTATKPISSKTKSQATNKVDDKKKLTSSTTKVIKTSANDKVTSKTQAVKPKTTKNTSESKTGLNKDKPVFTKAETKKLIEEAVKLALKKVGKID
ncbi:hypothetical protein [Spiroplasma endosymbiont of Panorpa germanica]|uniref:hypothetical protein n=1 Tax=Spiroplasma endosymbiont of Panorpa germanica TaxID=3066314 RepID=UPI0030CEDCE7